MKYVSMFLLRQVDLLVLVAVTAEVVECPAMVDDVPIPTIVLAPTTTVGVSVPLHHPTTTMVVQLLLVADKDLQDNKE